MFGLYTFFDDKHIRLHTLLCFSSQSRRSLQVSGSLYSRVNRAEPVFDALSYGTAAVPRRSWRQLKQLI